MRELVQVPTDVSCQGTKLSPIRKKDETLVTVQVTSYTHLQAKEMLFLPEIWIPSDSENDLS